MSRKNPYELNVRDLLRQPGELRERTIQVTAPEHLGEGLAAVQQDEVLDIAVRLESLHEGILATGTVSATADGQCARCLTALRIPLRVEFQELFAYPSNEPFEYEVHGDSVDLEPVIRDAVVLSLPFQPECPDGCAEIELAPGITLVLAEESRAAAVDERWAALAQLRHDSDRPREER